MRSSEELINKYIIILDYIEKVGGVITDVNSIKGLLNPKLGDVKYKNYFKDLFEHQKSEFGILWLNEETQYK